MSAARKAAEKIKPLVRYFGLYRNKTTEQVQAKLRKSEGAWRMKHVPIGWTIDLARIATGKTQIGLLLRIHAHTLGHREVEGQHPEKFAPPMIDEDFAKELGWVDRDSVRNAIQDALDRGASKQAIQRGEHSRTGNCQCGCAPLICRESDDPADRGFYRYRNLDRNWPAITEPTTLLRKLPRTQPEPEPPAPVEPRRVRSGERVQLERGGRYELDGVACSVVECQIATKAELEVTEEGVLQILAAEKPAQEAGVVEMPAPAQPPVELPAEEDQPPAARQRKTAEAPQPSPLGRKSTLDLKVWPKTVARVRHRFPSAGLPFFTSLITAARQAFVALGRDPGQLTDGVLVRLIEANDNHPKQYSPAMYVPNVVATIESWAETEAR